MLSFLSSLYLIMKSAAFWAILPFFLSASSAHAAQLPPKVNNLPYVANKYIIEVDSLANIANKREYKRVRVWFLSCMLDLC